MEATEQERVFIEIIKSMGGKDFDSNTPVALNEYARSKIGYVYCIILVCFRFCHFICRIRCRAFV